MKAELITIGDELLIGDTVDTNSAWMAKKLDEIGVEVLKISTISDDLSNIQDCIRQSLEKVELVLVTGGLGPTHDDVTKKALCQFFEDELTYSHEVHENVASILKTFGRDVNELNKEQAMIPSKCRVIPNKVGTAPGMVFVENDKKLISMPGVPREMKSMMESNVIPELKKNLNQNIIHSHLKTFGMPEAEMASLLEKEITELPKDIKLAFLPSYGHVKLRFTARSGNGISFEEDIRIQIEKFKKILGNIVYGTEGDSLEATVGRLLSEKNMSISTAESCTGGGLASRLTSIPGSSNYFLGGVVAYSNDVKIHELGVNKESLDKYGAVSEQVVTEMAVGVRNRTKSNFAVATSGIAGPDGGTKEKPVGTIWVALATENNIKTKLLSLGFNRLINIRMTIDYTLNMLRKELI